MSVTIHTDMPLVDYLAISAISGSSLKILLTEPEQYPLRNSAPDDDKPWLVRGSAAHALILEGPNAYEARYCTALDRADYPEAVETCDEMRAALRERGLPVSGNKPELLQRLTCNAPDVPIWSQIERAHREGRTEIDSADDAAIRAANSLISRDSRLRDLVSQGLPELTILWDNRGVQCKARLDYLSKRGITELKTISRGARLGQSSAQFLASTIANCGYDLQAAHNLSGLYSAHAALKAGTLEITGSAADTAAALVEFTAFRLQFLFVRLSGASAIWSAALPRFRRIDAERRRQLAILVWQQFQESHATCEPWSNIELGIDLDENDFPSWSWSV